MSDLRDSLERAVADRRRALERIKEETAVIATGKERIAHIEAAAEIIRECGQAIQTRAHEQIAAVVGKCLRAVFEENAFEFRILFETKRGKTEARLAFYMDGNEIDPLGGSGGGALDVAAFALRLAALILSKPARRRLIVLDEPFRFLSSDYIDRAREMLRILSEDLDIQFLIVTHEQGLASGNIIRIGGGES